LVRLALVGCGRNALALAKGISASADCELALAVDIHEQSARNIAATANGEPYAGDLALLLQTRSNDIDAIVINTPNDQHTQDVEAAISAGKHLLVEKPLALTSKTARYLHDRAHCADTLLMVGHTFRFMPSTQQVRRALDGGELGRPGMLRIHRWLPMSNGSSSEWEEHTERTGGLAIHECIHEIDQTLWLFGEHPTLVHAVAAPNQLQVHLGFESGAMAIFDVMAGLPLGESYYSLTLIGSLGSAYADDHHNMQLIYRGGRAEAFATNQHSLAVNAQIEEFVAAITQQREPSPCASDAIAALQIAEIVNNSVESGEPVRIPVRDHARN
jgi:UDP-N-acetyl-2-amino-2-deoxyglucuronate dehydrogenase